MPQICVKIIGTELLATSECQSSCNVCGVVCPALPPAAAILTNTEESPAMLKLSVRAVELSVWVHRSRTVTTSVYPILAMHPLSQVTVFGCLDQLIKRTAWPFSSSRPKTEEFDGAAADKHISLAPTRSKPSSPSSTCCVGARGSECENRSSAIIVSGTPSGATVRVVPGSPPPSGFGLVARPERSVPLTCDQEYSSHCLPQQDVLHADTQTYSACPHCDGPAGFGFPIGPCLRHQSSMPGACE
jgi:hypothetical protein